MVADDRAAEDATSNGISRTAAGESAKVRGIQEKSTTELVARLRELLRIADMTLSEQEFIVNCFRIKLAFEQLDTKMSNGAGMPEQWQITADFEDFRDIH